MANYTPSQAQMTQRMAEVAQEQSSAMPLGHDQTQDPEGSGKDDLAEHQGTGQCPFGHPDQAQHPCLS